MNLKKGRKKRSLKKKTIFRSSFEEEVFNSLPQKGCVYEPCKFSVDIPTTYTPDLVLPNGIYVEIKGFLRAESRRKYENFKKQFMSVKTILKKNGFKALHKKRAENFYKSKKFKKTFNYIFER